ncbi:MAG TPA: ATP-binding protein [Longimicrobiales bacterium]|nr:ATP-binding protein [Longimicrobiales bacterium]
MSRFAGGGHPWGWWPRTKQALLGVPLLHKILIANGLVVALGAGVGTALVAHFARGGPVRPTWTLVLTVGGVGGAVSVLANWLVLRVALSPLRRIEEAARRVEAGDVDARAELSPLADPSLTRLGRVLNEMLDSLSRYRLRLRRLAAGSVAAAEEERKRLSRELHDDTAQRLAALLLRLHALRHDLGDPALDRRLEGFRSEMADTLESIRRYARGLRPPALDDAGFEAAVRGLARDMAEAGLEVRVTVDALPGGLEEATELAVYRMIQESLSNVLRHSGAGEAEVRLGAGRGRLRVLVTDHGSGFDVEREWERGQGLGLFGLRERADQVGAVLDVRSAPGAGTTVRIDIPLQEPG